MVATQEFSRLEGVPQILEVLDSPAESSSRATKSRPILDGLIDRLNTIRNEKGVTQLAIGGVLYYWKRDDLWKHCKEYQDYWTFGNFCKEVAQMSLQKANSLIRIWQNAQRLDISGEEIDEIGWAKAQQLIRVADNREQVDEWMDYARGDTQDQFIDRVQDALRNEPQAENGTLKTVPKTQTVSFKLTRDQSDFWDETLEKAALKLKKEIGVNTSTQELVMFILAQWRTMAGDRE